MAFFFDPSKGETPQSIALKRELAARIMGKSGGRAPAKNAGEGWGNALASIGDGITANVMNRRADTGEKEGKAGAADLASRFRAMLEGNPDPAPTSTSFAENATPLDNIAPQAAGFSGSNQEFIDTLMPAALEASKRTGIDPRIIIAQSAQETGWGKSAPGNNFFGIKSHGKGGGQTFNTHEYVDGKRVNVSDSFRQYGSPDESVAGYADFMLQNPRYGNLRNAQGLDAQLAALQESGYATDPNYSRSVGSIARNINIPEQAPTQVASLDPSIGMPPNEMGAGMPVGQPAPPLPEPQMVSDMSVAEAPQATIPQQQDQMPPVAQVNSGPDIQTLLQVVSNPFMDEGTKAYAQMLLQQQVQAQDPSRQLDMEYKRAQIDKMGRGQDGSTEYGLNPIWGQDRDGKPVLGVLGKDGSFKQVDTGQFDISSGTEQIDLGDSYAIKDKRSGEIIGQVPKNLAQAEQDKVTGKSRGEAIAAAPSDVAAGQSALDILSQIRDHPSRQMATGKSSWTGRFGGTGAYDFTQLVEQAKSGAFLSAIQQMRGMGSLSNAEGQTATAAVTRMNTALSEEGFIGALDDYEKIVRQGMERAQSKIGQGAIRHQIQPAPQIERSEPAAITNEQDFLNLPSGTKFIAPDGSVRVKP